MRRFQLIKYYYWMDAFVPVEAFIAPVVVVFYLHYVDISFATYSFYIASLCVLNAVLEVPFGIVSDVIGRRKALLIGEVFLGLGFLVIIIFPGVPALYVAAIFVSGGGALSSGNLNAIGYEALRDAGMDKGHFTTFLARMSTVSISIAAIASLLSGLLAMVNLALPMIVDILLIAIRVALGFIFLMALWPRKNIQRKESVKLFLTRCEIWDVWSILRTRSFLRATTLGIATFALLRTSLNFYQPILIEKGISQLQLGILFSGGILLSALVSRGILRRTTIKIHTYDAMIIFVVLTFFSGMLFWVNVESSILVVCGFFLHQVLRVFIPAVTVAETHAAIAQGHSRRTTIASVVQFMQAVITGIAVVTSGFIQNLMGYQTTVGVLHVTALIFVVFLFVLTANKPKKKYD